MARLNRPGQEERLAHLHTRFKRAEPHSGSRKVWKQLRTIGGAGALMLLGAALGSGTFLMLDAINPDAKRGNEFSLRDIHYQTCREAFQDGRANIRRGEPGYRPELDADNDGIACEPFLRRQRLARLAQHELADVDATGPEPG